MSVSEQSLASEILQTRVGVITHLAPLSSLTSQAVLEDFGAAVEECLHRRETQLVLDLSTVQLLNSAALNAMVDMQDRLVRLGGWLKVVNANPLVLDIFRITGFTEYVSIMDGDAAALLPGKPAKAKLGDLLVEKGLITPERVDEAISLQKKMSKRTSCSTARSRA